MGSRGQVSIALPRSLTKLWLLKQPLSQSPREAVPAMERAQPWRKQQTPGRSPTTADHHKMCKPEPGTSHARGRRFQATPQLAQNTPWYFRVGNKIQLPAQLHFYLKEMGKMFCSKLAFISFPLPAGSGSLCWINSTFVWKINFKVLQSILCCSSESIMK